MILDRTWPGTTLKCVSNCFSAPKDRPRRVISLTVTSHAAQLSCSHVNLSVVSFRTSTQACNTRKQGARQNINKPSERLRICSKLQVRGDTSLYDTDGRVVSWRLSTFASAISLVTNERICKSPIVCNHCSCGDRDAAQAFTLLSLKM